MRVKTSGFEPRLKRKKPARGGLFGAERTGLEPATSGLTGQRSNRLNYHSVTKIFPNVGTWQVGLVGEAGIEPTTNAV